MRVLALPLVSTAVAALLFTALPAAARTDCRKNVTAVCIELANDVTAYQQLLWAICDADSETVCKCYDAQQVESGVDWCPWATCACGALKDKNLKSGTCGLASACTSVGKVREQQQQVAAQSAPAQLASQVAQVRGGAVVDCSPETCMAAGAVCARAAGALEILKDRGSIKDGPSCAKFAVDATAFGKQLHVDGLTPALGACACAAVF